MKLINPEKDNDLEITDKVLYRYEGEMEDHFRSIVTYKIVLRTLQIVSETPKGYWIRDRVYWKRWVSKTAGKRYAYPTKKEALFNFTKRKEKHLKILESQLQMVKQLINQIKDVNTDEVVK